MTTKQNSDMVDAILKLITVLLFVAVSLMLVSWLYFIGVEHTPQTDVKYGCPGCSLNFMGFAEDMCNRVGSNFTVSDGVNTLQCSELTKNNGGFIVSENLTKLQVLVGQDATVGNNGAGGLATGSEETYHSDNYLKRYPFEPNFVEADTSDCKDPEITTPGYIYSAREGTIISWMTCNNTEFDYAMVTHANGTKWEKRTKPTNQTPVIFISGSGGGQL